MEKKYDDDDGRTIADMSGLDNNSVFSGLLTGLNRAEKKRKKRLAAKEEVQNADAQAETSEEKKTRRLYAFGAMRAGLLIGLIYLAAFAALIVILLLIWGKL